MYRGSFSYLAASALIIVLISVAYLFTVMSLDRNRYEIYDKDMELLIRIFTILYCLNMSQKVERIGIYTVEPVNSTAFDVRTGEEPHVKYTIYLEVSNLYCEALFN